MVLIVDEEEVLESEEQERYDRISRDINFLASKEAAGRLSGTKEARLVAEYLAGVLKESHVTPAGEDGYFTYLPVKAARITEPIRLSIGEKAFKHRDDFGEIPRYSYLNGGTVGGELLIVRDGENVKPEDLKDKVVLISEQPDGFDLAQTVEGAEKIGVKALLYESGEPRFFHKSINGPNQDRIPVLRIRKSIVNEMVELNGQKVLIDLPIQTTTKQCQNVIGFIQSDKDTEKTLVLTAHYDHLGDDPGGYRFPGAVDNGSGVAVMLEVVRELAKKKGKLPFHIIVVFTTGEESGLIGAKHFVKMAPLPITAAINLDSVGFEPELNVMRTGHKKPTERIAVLAAKIMEKHGAIVKWIAGGEDSLAFQQAGIAAVGIGQKPTDPKERSIHTPDDNFQNIYMKPITKSYEIIMELIFRLAKEPNII